MVLTFLRKIYRDSLFLNSLYLMSSTAVVAGFGFFFWLINAQLFLTEEIGLATALISVMNLVSILSLIGFNATFIRFLPSSERPNDKLNTGILLVGLTSIVLTGTFVAFSSIISPSLHSLLNTPATAGAFIFLSMLCAVNAITDSVFLAHRQTKYVFTVNFATSFCKILLPFLFVGFGAFGIFAAAAAAQAVGFVLSITILVRKFNFRPQFIIHRDILLLVWRYSAANYLASVLNLLPVTLLPIIIVNQLGAHEAAYYYIVMMIGNLLYTIPWATARSLFAEGSNDESLLTANFKKAIASIAFLLTPSILFLLIAGNYILHIFGSDFATEGVTLLRLIAISGVVVSTVAIFGSFFQVKKNLLAIITVNTISAATTITLSLLLLPLGLTGIGIAWFVGNSIAALTGYLLYRGPEDFYGKARELLFVKTAVPISKVRYLRARYQRGTRKVALCYPEKPRPFHNLYLILHNLGYRITNNPKEPYDVVIHFEDTTFGRHLPVMAELQEKHHVINAACTDISKERVDAVFSEVFGYSSFVDPRTYPGTYVRKSNLNTTHDGKPMQGPTAPEEGYIYQMLINSDCQDGLCREMRVIVIGGKIVVMFYRYRYAHSRFSHVCKSEWVEPDTALNKEDQAKILSFCDKFGLEYGELDVLRHEDGRIYILDANNTPAAPVSGLHITKSEFAKSLALQSKHLSERLLTPHAVR